MKLPNYESVQLEIPNPHVLDSAEQFYAGASVLNKMPPGSGVLLPSLTTAALAMELYIKSMTSWSVIKDYQDHGSDVFGGIVTAEPQQRNHTLSKILESVLPEVKNNIDELYSKNVIECNFDGLLEQVKKYDSFFVNVRYSYENSYLRDLNLSELMSTVELLEVGG